MNEQTDVRHYGDTPYTVVVVHGGPGAPGEMKLVAEELSHSFGVLEPLQSADSVNGQVDELRRVIEENCSTPVYLIGWSWGAWLSYLFAATFPQLVKKLILVSSGPFEEKYVKEIQTTRMGRLSVVEQQRVESITAALRDGSASTEMFKQFGELMNKADSFVTSESDEESEFQPAIYEKVWGEAAKMRSSGELLELGKKIVCPTVAIHGDFDPHPFEGVKIPLSKVIRNFHFVLLKNCGHTPWKEKQAKDIFYKQLKLELE